VQEEEEEEEEIRTNMSRNSKCTYVYIARHRKGL
jgi:hypothetical protein